MPMKFRAHDTFFIRKGWLSKGMRCVAKKPDVFIAHDENPMDVLGIGANMVKALRYWLQTIGLTEEPNKGKRIQSFTDLGKLMSEEVKVNNKAVERLKKWIILMENQNNKTRSKTDPEMVKAIKKRIEEEANAAAIN